MYVYRLVLALQKKVVLRHQEEREDSTLPQPDPLGGPYIISATLTLLHHTGYEATYWAGEMRMLTPFIVPIVVWIWNPTAVSMRMYEARVTTIQYIRLAQAPHKRFVTQGSASGVWLKPLPIDTKNR